MASIRKNAIYNVLLAVSQVLFPLITFPYISRILQPQGLGAVAFVESYTQYFIIIAALGIPVYGVREIARVRNNPADRQKVFAELVTLHFIMSMLLMAVYVTSFMLLPSLQPYRSLFWLGTILLLSNVFLVEWLYQGMEAFPFITIRTLLVRALAVVLIFVFIKQRQDLVLYFGINCGLVVVNALVNFLYSKQYVSFLPSLVSLKQHIKPLLFIFSTSIVTSIYTLLDGVLLGFLANTTSVGYYAMAVKLSKILIMILSALSAVLVPQLSLAIKEQRFKQANQLLKKSFEYVCFIAVPLSVGLFVLAAPLVRLFAGENFLSAIILLKILSPTVLFVGMSYVFGMQVLNPTGNERYFFRAAVLGMAISLILNFILIPIYQHQGAAITNLFVEACVMVTLIYFGLRKLDFKPKWKKLSEAFIASIPFFIIAYLSQYIIDSDVIAVLFIGTCSVLTYFTIQVYVWKNGLLKDFLSNAIKTRK